MEGSWPFLHPVNVGWQALSHFIRSLRFRHSKVIAPAQSLEFHSWSHVFSQGMQHGLARAMEQRSYSESVG
jgi:hypothetical protein